MKAESTIQKQISSAAMVVKPYREVRHLMRTGDLIAWRGFGHDVVEYFFSLGIMTFTGPVTHCSTVVIVQSRQSRRIVAVAEAMAKGFVLDSLDRRIAMVAEGRWKQAWWLPLSEARRDRLKEYDLVDYALDKLEAGTKYDVRQSVCSAFDWPSNKSDDAKLFCSEAHVFALLSGGAVEGLQCQRGSSHGRGQVRCSRGRVLSDIRKEDGTDRREHRPAGGLGSLTA